MPSHELQVPPTNNFRKNEFVFFAKGSRNGSGNDDVITPRETEFGAKGSRNGSGNDDSFEESFLRWANMQGIPRVSYQLREFSRGRGRHNRVRGVALSKPTSILEERKETVVFQTRGILSDDYYAINKLDWDTRLTLALWTEIRKGKKSHFSEYISLLLKMEEFVDSAYCPPTLVPLSPRHWPSNSLSCLPNNFLETIDRQNEDWRLKFDNLGVDNHILDLSYDQFRWGMEVIYSRAFCGVSTTITKWERKLLAFQFGSLVVGFFDVLSIPAGFPSDVLLAICAVGAFAPVLRYALPGNNGEVTGCLLPVIDSCNHDSSAGSKISFDILNRKFSLFCKGSCVRTTPGLFDELVISYGKRSQEDLLLNYGFVEDMRPDCETEEEWREAVCKHLQTFG